MLYIVLVTDIINGFRDIDNECIRKHNDRTLVIEHLIFLVFDDGMLLRKGICLVIHHKPFAKGIDILYLEAGGVVRDNGIISNAEIVVECVFYVAGLPRMIQTEQSAITSLLVRVMQLLDRVHHYIQQREYHRLPQECRQQQSDEFGVLDSHGYFIL